MADDQTTLPDPDDPRGPAFWDRKFDATELHYGSRPNAWLVDQSYRLNPGARVLVPADGEGRNGVWLAEQGHRVTSVDFSPRGLQKASALALSRGVSLKTVCADLRTWDWPEAAFDGVVLTFLHIPPESRTKIFPRAAAALVPGGVLILEGFAPAQHGRSSGGPSNPALLFDQAVLRDLFGDLDILALEEAEMLLDEGTGHRGMAAVTRLCAVKPS